MVESLDKMIKKIEDEQDKQRRASPIRCSPAVPPKTARPWAARRPATSPRKDIGHKSGWGDLPPKEREEALQQMGRDFPPHYRDAIEEYFRKLAAEENSDDDK